MTHMQTITGKTCTTRTTGAGFLRVVICKPVPVPVSTRACNPCGLLNPSHSLDLSRFGSLPCILAWTLLYSVHFHRLFPYCLFSLMLWLLRSKCLLCRSVVYKNYATVEWARVRCPGPELVVCSDDAGNACNKMIIGNVYELVYIRWSHVLGHLVGHVMGWSSHYSMCPPRTRQRPRCLKNDKPKKS